jgi:UDP-3-O-[3-hydroxymyristoyl] N-acetylglucosamine deacetylase
MSDTDYGEVLAGDETAIREACRKWAEQPVDQVFPPENGWNSHECETTLAKSFQVSGPGTFFHKAQRTLAFEPSLTRGWRFDRTDLATQMPIVSSVRNVWTTARNIVLASGSPHNYMRMVEHIIALKLGMHLDNVVVRMDSGDPPLFDRGSIDLVEGVEQAGIVPTEAPARWVTVKEPVSVGGRHGSFLSFLPAESGSHDLFIDCAVDFPSAIGKQRIQFTVSPGSFRYGALARTNTTFWKVLFCMTIGKLFADTRNLGYTNRNILIAGPRRYMNAPLLMHNDKSLEAVWHRATLDLLAAVALIDKGRFAGTIHSYKAGHTLDVQMIRRLYREELLCEVT